MQRGASHERDSVINLAWYNKATMLALTFLDFTIYWKGSLGSNYAMLHMLGCTTEPPTWDNSDTDLGFIVDLNKSEEWINTVKARLLPFIF